MGADGGVPGDQEVATGFPRSLAPVIFWGAAGAAACLAMAPLEPSLLEEGLIVHVAQRLSRGERLYSEVASFTGPIPYELLALLFRLFGESIAVARGAVAVLAALACASTFAVARRAGAGALAHAAAAAVASVPVFLFPLLSTYFYSTLACQATLITAYAGVRGTRSISWAVATGALIACVALCKQSVGAVLAIAMIATLASCTSREWRWRTVAAVVAGGIATAALTSAYYAMNSEFGAFFDSVAVMPMTFVDDFDSAYLNLWPPGELAPALAEYGHFYTPYVYNALHHSILEIPPPRVVFATQVLYALPFLALVATAVRRLRGPLPVAVWIHAAAVIALVSNLFPRSDWGHLVFVLAPAVVQLLLLVPRQSARSSRLRTGWAALLVVGIGVSALVVGNGLWAIARPDGLSKKVPQRPVSGAMKDPALEQVIKFLVNRTRPGEAIFVPRSEPLIYFATDTRNPTPYSGVIPGMLEEQEAVIVNALVEVRYVVMSEIDQPVFTYYRDLLPGVQAYLERHFRVARKFVGKGAGWIIVLERAADRGPAAIDLMAIRDDFSSAWVRNEEGVVAPPVREPPRLASMQNRRPMPILLGAGGGGIDFEIDVPDAARLQADIGLEKIRGRRVPHPTYSRFLFSAGRDGVFEPLETFKSRRRSDDGSRWRSIEIDLEKYAGERVLLRIEVIPAFPSERRRVAWLGSPRIVTGAPPVEATD